jgi:uncharacterized membrane protein
MALGIEQATLVIILGTLLAIVYSLRILVLLERRMARMDLNVEKMTGRVLKEEMKIEKALFRRSGSKKKSKKRK